MVKVGCEYTCKAPLPLCNAVCKLPRKHGWSSTPRLALGCERLSLEGTPFKRQYCIFEESCVPQIGFEPVFCFHTFSKDGTKDYVSRSVSVLSLCTCFVDPDVV